MMLDHLIVPVDLSASSLATIGLAATLADRVGGQVDAICVVSDAKLVRPAATELNYHIARLGPLPVTIHREVIVADSPATAIIDTLIATPEATLVMASQGRGRSAAVFGSTLADVLRRSARPVIVLGPNADLTTCETGGEYFVPLDGSDNAEAVLPIVAEWTAELGGSPTVVEVATASYHDAASAYLRAQAAGLADTIGRPVDYELIHGGDIGRAIAERADAVGASLIFIASHGRTGIGRLASGAVAAGVVRHARMPVVVLRPADVGAAQLASLVAAG